MKTVDLTQFIAGLIVDVRPIPGKWEAVERKHHMKAVGKSAFLALVNLLAIITFTAKY
jgi:hypothetical protein